MKRKDTEFNLFKGFLILIVMFCCQFVGAQLVAEISVTDPTANETGVQQAQFQVDLVPTGIFIIGQRTVNYSIAGTATGAPGADYTALTGTAVFPPGVVTQVINVTGINDDNIVEGTETVVVTLTSCVACNLNPDPAKLTGSVDILDNDIGVVSLDVNMPPFDDVATEGPGGDNGRFRIVLDKPNGTGAPITVNYTITGTAAGSDYQLTGAVAMTFANDESQVARNLNVVPLDDLVSEPDETVVLTLDTVNGPLFSASGSATVTIVDDDCAAGASAPTRNANLADRCDEANLNLNTLITGGVNGGPGGAAAPLRWSLVQNPTAANQLLANATVTSSNTYYGLYWDNTNACASPSVAVAVTLNTSPNAGTTTNAARCNDNTFGITTIDLDNTLAGADAGGNWTYVSGGSGNPGINGNNVVNFNGDPLGDYVFRYTVAGAGACSNDSVNVTITVNDCDPCVAGNTAPILDSSVETEFCDAVDAAISLNDYTNSTPPTGTTLKWSTDSDPENESAHRTPAQIADPLPGTYYGFFWDAINTCASPTLVVSLEVTPTPTITATTGADRCGPGTVTLTATVTGNPTINWYNAATGGSPVSSGASFTTPSISVSRSYWVEATENNCNTSPRVEVQVVIIPQPSAGTPTDTSACSDPTYGNTVLNLNGQLEGEDPGSWAFTSGPTNVDPGTGDAVDFIGTLDGVYVFTYTTTGAQAPCVNESASVTVSVSNCDTDDDGDGLFGGTEQALGTDPQNADTDGDGIQDGVEVGPDINNPLDEDGDGIIDALDSNIADIDVDGVVDQLDPANENPCIPNRLNGVCDFDNDDIPDTEEEANGSDPDDPCSPNPDHPNCSPIDLEILKVVDNENAVVGDNVTFTVTVNNLDPTRIARSIIIGDLLEVGFEYVSNTASSGSFDVVTSEWNIAELGPMASATLAMNVLILEGGPYTNTATLLSSLPEDETLANNEATAQVNINLPEGVDLALEKTALSANPLVNEMVIFTIKVTNQSINGDTVNNIQVEDIIPSGVDSPFVYVSHEGVGVYDLATGIWTIETLGVSQEAVLTIVVNVPNQGTFTNTARIIRSSPADANPNNNEMTATVIVSKPNPAEVGFLFNQFSPNGDGTNDWLEINRVNPQNQQTSNISYNVQIFNRYGNLVFNGKNMTEAAVWDGSWEGKEAPDGTYFYIMNINVGNGPQTKKGWIQLIR